MSEPEGLRKIREEKEREEMEERARRRRIGYPYPTMMEEREERIRKDKEWKKRMGIEDIYK